MSATTPEDEAAITLDPRYSQMVLDAWNHWEAVSVIDPVRETRLKTVSKLLRTDTFPVSAGDLEAFIGALEEQKKGLNESFVLLGTARQNLTCVIQHLKGCVAQLEGRLDPADPNGSEEGPNGLAADPNGSTGQIVREKADKPRSLPDCVTDKGSGGMGWSGYLDDLTPEAWEAIKPAKTDYQESLSDPAWGFLLMYTCPYETSTYLTCSGKPYVRNDESTACSAKYHICAMWEMGDCKISSLVHEDPHDPNRLVAHVPSTCKKLLLHGRCDLPPYTCLDDHNSLLQRAVTQRCIYEEMDGENINHRFAGLRPAWKNAPAELQFPFKEFASV